jgi:formate hydrogenlyase transcriptional activator
VVTPDSHQLPGRLEFETLIADTSAELFHAAPPQVAGAIESSLERVRLFFAADRCALLAVHVGRPAVNVLDVSLATGVADVSKQINLAELFPWTYQRLVVDGVPVFTRTGQLPPEAAVDRANNEHLGIRSALAVPVTSEGRVSHVMVLNSVADDRDWPPEYVPRLRVLGELMAAAVHRARGVEALRAAHEEVKRLRDRLERENAYLRKEVAHHANSDLVLGRSPAIREALTLAEQVAATSSTVLLTGETGTGKERFASFIHQASSRRGHHMVRVNCSAIPSPLIESELFGREKGAYTGALSKQVGRFELAHGSTLFLDEIGDLPIDVQVKLLRVLQERTIERLGSPAPIEVDVRIIAATNRDLEAAVRAGTFRADLYYRLNVFPIDVPPLRRRREDIPELVAALVGELSTQMRKRIDGVEDASLDALTRYDWPGNVRELRNVLERAMILASGPTLIVAPPQASPTAGAAPGTRVGSGNLLDLEREHILRVLGDTGWRIRGKHGAAEVLGLKPTTLDARLVKLGIHRPEPRGRH